VPLETGTGFSLGPPLPINRRRIQRHVPLGIETARA
jgi:hypothetical protein